MKFTTISRRIAATGAVSAMAAGALVGLTSTAAHADPVVNNQYTCSVGDLVFPVFLTSNAPGLEVYQNAGLKAGMAIPGGLLTVTNTFTIPDGVHSALQSFSVTDIAVPDFTGTFGGNAVRVEGVAVTFAGMTQNADTTWSSDSTEDDGDPREGDGLNAAFVAPEAGAQDVLSPATLDLVANTSTGGQIPVACTIAEGTTPGSYSTITLVKSDPTIVGKATKKSFAQGKVAKVKATVSGGNLLEGDKVLLKMGSKKLDSALLNADGVATLSTKKLPVGKNKLKVVYKATGYNNGTSAPVVVKVTK